MKTKKLLIIVLIMLLFITAQNEASAYINPGSGSDFFQIIMSTILGVLTAIKNFITGMFGKKKQKEDKYE